MLAPTEQAVARDRPVHLTEQECTRLDDLMRDIRYHIRRAAESIAETGKLLMEAKALLGQETTFKQWLAGNGEYLGIKSYSTATNYMQAAVFAAKHVATFANIPPDMAVSIQWELFQPSTPLEAVEDVIEQYRIARNAGAKLSVNQSSVMVDSHKIEKQEILDYLQHYAPPELTARVAEFTLDATRAYQITKFLENAPDRVKRIVLHGKVTDPGLIAPLIKLARHKAKALDDIEASLSIPLPEPVLLEQATERDLVNLLNETHMHNNPVDSVAKCIAKIEDARMNKIVITADADTIRKLQDELDKGTEQFVIRFGVLRPKQVTITKEQ